MPGRRLTPLDDSLCRRCQAIEPAIVVRTEPLCKPCFAKYVQSKIVKRMETFRVRHSDPGKERKLLLPLNPDACSVALLHVLTQHLDGQRDKTGRTGFRLSVVHIDHELSPESVGLTAFAKIQARYPDHHYHSLPLSAIAASPEIAELFPQDPDSSTPSEDPQDRLHRVLHSCKSATSRQDLEQILTQRLIVRYAIEQDCEAVLWTDTTTRLAERTLAETAKGRGLALPWIVADGNSPHGIPFYYPLRELMNKELESYVAFLHPPIDPALIKVATKPIVSTKNTTIDDLMKLYFVSVEQDYPSIVANVVRTTGKLQPTSLQQVKQQCELCNLPLDGQAPEKSRVCYGCIRLIPDSTS